MYKKERKLKKGVHRNLILRMAQNFRDHKVGIPEWLKNSDDSYVRHEKNKDLKYKLDTFPLILNIAKNEIVCLDFGGADPNILDQHLLYYGDPKAATQGKDFEKGLVSGGHGSGGKYYGLAQFDECDVIDFYNGKLTTYKLTKKEDVPGDFNKEVSAEEVASLIGLNHWAYFNQEKQLYLNIINGKVNMFCWKGLIPVDRDQIKTPREVNKIIKALTANPQTIPVLRSRMVDVLLDGKPFITNLKPLDIIEDPSLGKREFALPDQIGKYKFNKYGKSKLILRFSRELLTGEKEGLNVLDITAHGRSIAYYKLTSLMIDKGPSRYITSKIECPDLDDYKCITNERIELASNPVSDAFLEWCKSKIQEVIDEINAKERQEMEVAELKMTKKFLQDVLDKLTNLLDEEMLKKIYSPKGTETGTVEIPTGEPGYGDDGKIKQRGGGKRRGGTETGEGPSKQKKDVSKLRIYISDLDPDPLNKEGKSRSMSPRDPVVDQRAEDVPYGIWWLNSQKEYVKKIKVSEPAGRPFYLFVVKEVVLFTKGRQMLNDEGVEDKADRLQELDLNLIDEVFNRVINELGIPMVDEKSTEKLRNAIKNKDEFTVSELSEETGIDKGSINAAINTSLAEEVKKNFKKAKTSSPNGRRVNIYKKI